MGLQRRTSNGPAALDQHADVACPPDRPPIPRLPMHKTRVLLVEDEFLIRLTLCEALAEDGFEVIEASDGIEAMRLLNGVETFALLLTDVQLPGGFAGPDIARRFRERQGDLPVIFMTGRPEALSGAAANPRDMLIVKPYTPSAICAAARRLTGAT